MMNLDVKICGLNTEYGIRMAVVAGASHVGLMFYPRSPRAVTLEQAAHLRALVPPTVKVVAVVVDPDDVLLDEIIAAARPDMLQLHGSETPARVMEIKARTGLPVIKAIRLAGPEDLAAAAAFDGVADMLLFDAKPPKNLAGALPGGNGLAFDWQLLAGYDGSVPWMLSGGLDADNLAEAVRISGAGAVDTSSGVEDRPGLKNTDKIRDFLYAAEAIAG